MPPGHLRAQLPTRSSRFRASLAGREGGFGHSFTQIEHNRGAELPAELIAQRLQRREVRRRHGGAGRSLDGRDRRK